MYGRMYEAVGTVASVTAAKDLIEISAPADAVVVVHELHITNDTIETSQQIAMTISKAGTGGSGGTVETAAKLQTGDPAFGGGVESGNTTQATTLTTIKRISENILNGHHFVPIPQGRIILSPSEILVARFEEAPATASTYSFTVTFEEIGG